MYASYVHHKTSISECGTGLRQFGYSCYRFHTYTNLYWDEAKKQCEQQEAHLVSIETKAEFDFLKGEIKHEMGDMIRRELWWTSGRKDRKSNKWIWDDGAGQCSHIRNACLAFGSL